VSPPPFAELPAVLDALPIGVSVYGPDDRLLFVNRAYGEVMAGAYGALGERREEIVRRRLAEGEYGAGEEASAFAREIGATLAPPRKHRRKRPDGRTIEVRIVRLDGGALASIAADVTEAVEAEAELSLRIADTDEMLAQIQHGIMLFDRENRLLAYNPLIERMFDLPPGLLHRGRTVAEAVSVLRARGEYGPEAEAAAFLRRWHVRDRTSASVHQRVTRAGRVLEVRSNPTRSGGHINTYTDITDLRATEAELRRAKEQAEAGSAAKSRFLATIGHELLTPLNAVIGFSELLAGEAVSPAAPPAQLAEFAGAILAAGKRLSVLINAVLDVARIESSTFDLSAAPIDPRRLVDAALHHAAAAAADAGVGLASALPPELPPVRGDARRLGQALDHLLSNAIKFSQAGGRVMVEAEIRDGGRLVFRVRDTGIGIGETDLERLFQPFRQVEDGLARRFEGAGLGLFVSRAVAEAHGGSLTLESAPGQGTTAILELPIATLPLPPHLTTGRS
jgi:signal transduction histidine kinase